MTYFLPNDRWRGRILWGFACLLVAARATGATLYVSLQSTNPVPPYATWDTAATNIQDAIGATQAGDTVLVTNGIYTAASVVLQGATNCVALTNPITVLSVNGAQATTLSGTTSTRCAYVASNAVLNGFALMNGSASGQNGGGAWCQPGGLLANSIIASNSAGGLGGGDYGGILTNCSVITNSADQGGGVYTAVLYGCSLSRNAAYLEGGGADGFSVLYNCNVSSNAISGPSRGGGGAGHSTLYNCTLIGNNAGSCCDSYGGGTVSCTNYNCLFVGNSGSSGGGAFYSTLISCTLAGNSASGLAGGVVNCSLTNCIVYFNSSSANSNWAYNNSFDHCCTAPLPSGLGNISSNPMFMNLASGDFRLHFGSPCIDAGTNLSGLISNDIAGNPRPLDGKGNRVPGFDIGAYQFNLLATVGTNWLLSYGLNPNDPLVFASHPNGVPFSVLQAWIADANPTNASSFLEAAAISNVPPVTVYFQSSSNRIYSLAYSANPQTNWTPVPGQVYVPGTGGMMSLKDANAVAQQRFYRVSVAVP